MQISNNKVVSIDYTLTNDTGEVIDTSKGGEPLAYIQGIGNIIPGLEAALEGHKVGDELKVSIPPEKGYGVRNEDSLRTFPREAFSGIDEIEEGMQFMAQMENSQQMFTVVSVNEDTIVGDSNHPLAGMTLNFDVAVRDVRDATDEELSHGHDHAGGHHH
jgi:FKBP-type peptidyl-prolyl cis-trans isomerase SlyD